MNNFIYLVMLRSFYLLAGMAYLLIGIQALTEFPLHYVIFASLCLIIFVIGIIFNMAFITKNKIILYLFLIFGIFLYYYFRSKWDSNDPSTIFYLPDQAYHDMNSLFNISFLLSFLFTLIYRKKIPVKIFKKWQSILIYMVFFSSIIISILIWIDYVKVTTPSY